MATCFVFFNELEAESFLSLKLNDDGGVQAPLGIRSVEEIKSIQSNAKTIIMLSGEYCGFHEVALAYISESKARVALPYALEDQLAQPVKELHFAFDKSLYQNNQYLVAVISRADLSAVMNHLEELNLPYQEITTAWFALEKGEICLNDEALLLHLDDFKGALPKELAEKYLSSHQTSTLPIKGFTDSADFAKTQIRNLLSEPSQVWVAKRLLKKPYINFCQGEYKISKGEGKPLFWYKACAFVFGLWIFAAIAFDVTKVMMFNQKMALLDEKIKVIYQDFFPEATQVISPKFRIEQLLKSGRSEQADDFWRLVSKLGQSFDPSLVTIKEMRFQNNRLFVDLSSPDFAKLENYEKKLRNNQLLVEQTQASTKDGEVVATLELQ